MTQKNEKELARTTGKKDLQTFLKQDDIRQRFELVCGKNAGAFIGSLATLVYGAPQLQDCSPVSLVACTLKAAALNLTIDPSLGHAYLVPYKGKDGVKVATFQIGWKGLVQLALRTGEYRNLNVAHVQQGLIINIHPVTGEFEYGKPEPDAPLAGVAAYLRLKSGFEKTVYWTLDEIRKHKEKFSQGHQNPNSAWQTNKAAMEKKTVLKDLVSKWGIVSFEMRSAMQADESGVIDAGFVNPATPDSPAFPKDAAPDAESQPQNEAEDYADPVFVSAELEREAAQRARDNAALWGEQ